MDEIFFRSFTDELNKIAATRMTKMLRASPEQGGLSVAGRQRLAATAGTKNAPVSPVGGTRTPGGAVAGFRAGLSAAKPAAESPEGKHFFRKAGLEEKLKKRYSPETAEAFGPSVPTTPGGGLHSSLARLGIKQEPALVQ